MRVAVDGGTAGRGSSTASSTRPASSSGSGFIREPVVSPDGRTIAMATDLPDPTKSDVTLKLLDLKNEKITDLKLDQVAAAGPPGPGVAARRRNACCTSATTATAPRARPGSTLYTPDTGKARAVTGPGYLHPAWSPDGRYIAATKTSAYRHRRRDPRRGHRRRARCG